MPTRRIFRLVVIMGVAAWAAGGVVKLAALRHLADDEPGSIGRKVGAAVAS